MADGLGGEIELVFGQHRIHADYVTLFKYVKLINFSTHQRCFDLDLATYNKVNFIAKV
jgi:hypothetical protein